MIDQASQDELVIIAQKELAVTLTESQKAGLLAIHEGYFYRLKEKPHTTASELREQCVEIERASKTYLKAIKRPLPILYRDELLHRELVHCIKAYRDLAQELREYFEPVTMKKRWAEQGRVYRGPQGRRRNWPLHKYVREMAGWYEEVTGEKASGAIRAVFVRLLLSCFRQINPDSDYELSRDMIKDALKRMRGG